MRTCGVVVHLPLRQHSFLAVVGLTIEANPRACSSIMIVLISNKLTGNSTRKLQSRYPFVL